MKLKTAFISATIVASAFLIGSVVVAHESGSKDGFLSGHSGHGEFRGGGHGGPAMLMGKRVLRQLDLSPEQEDAAMDIFENAKPQMHELHTAKRDSMQRLMAITPDDPSYAAVVDEVAQANAEAAARATRLATQVQAEVYALLTDAQKAQAAEFKAEMLERMEEHRSRRAERFGPPADSQ
ncbi:MAG: Spy/CpxP family protein refolding chaperone [Pseudomonadota bacterium]